MTTRDGSKVIIYCVENYQQPSRIIIIIKINYNYFDIDVKIVFLLHYKNGLCVTGSADGVLTCGQWGHT